MTQAAQKKIFHHFFPHVLANWQTEIIHAVWVRLSSLERTFLTWNMPNRLSKSPFQNYFPHMFVSWFIAQKVVFAVTWASNSTEHWSSTCGKSRGMFVTSESSYMALFPSTVAQWLSIWQARAGSNGFDVCWENSENVYK